MTIKPDSKYSHLFDTGRINKEVKQRSVQAGVANLISQGLSLFITLARAAILARLLSPDDYGIFTMVIVVVSFALIFKDLGLSTATIREKTITHAQVSNLFWINSLVGLASMAIVVTVAPFIVWFYHDPRLAPITVALSIAFLFGGLSVQHQALLKRQMRFGNIAVITIFSTIFSSILGVLLAWWQHNYWALIWMNISQSFFLLIGFWYSVGWWPSFPQRNAETKKFLKIGLDVAALNAFSTLSRDIDKIIVGRISNSTLLGLYNKGGQVPDLIAGQFRMAFFSVTLPALSSLQSEQERFASYYYKFLNVVSWTTMSLSAFCFIFADEIIQIYFGPQWTGAIIYMKIFSIHSFLMPAITTLDQVPLALGHSRRYLVAGIVRSVGTLVGVSAGGLLYGVVGIAIGVSIANIITFIPFFSLCSKNSPVSMKKYLVNISTPLSTSLILGVLFYYMKYHFMPNNVFHEISYMVGFFTSITMAFIICDFCKIGCHLGITDMIMKKFTSKRAA